ncbi:AsmA family protein [Methylobacterium sp. JK268]
MKLRTLSLLVAAAGCLVVGAVAATGSALVVRAVEAQLAAETGRPWTVRGGASLSFWPRFAVVVRDVGTSSDFPGVGRASLDIGSLRATGAPLDLIAGRGLREVEVEHPVLRWPSEWWRAGAAPAAQGSPTQGSAAQGSTTQEPPSPQAPAAAEASPGPRPERVRVTGGALLLVDGETVTASVEDVTAEARPGEGGVSVTASGRTGGGAASCEIALAPPAEGDAAPLTYRCRLPRFGDALLEGRADAARHGAVVTLSRLSGEVAGQRADKAGSRAAPASFTGAVVVDLAAKPFVRLDLAAQALDLPAPGPAPDTGAAPAPGPGAPEIDPGFLRSFDGRARLRVASLRAGGLALSDLAVDGRLTEGAVEAALTQAGLAGGQVRGTFTSDIARENRGGAAPRHALHLDLTQVRSLPLLGAVSGFALLDGTAGAAIDLRATGTEREALARSLSGEAAIQVENGRLTGIDIPGVVQSIAQQLSPDPRLRASDATAFDRISARFRIAEGRASTQDLALAGPLVTAKGAGTIDLAARSLSFRIEPRLTRSAAKSLPKLLDMSLPVTIAGSWDAPQVGVDLGAVLNGQTLSNLGALGAEMLGNGKSGQGSPLGGMLDSFLGGGGGGGGAPAPRGRTAPRAAPPRPGGRP